MSHREYSDPIAPQAHRVPPFRRGADLNSGALRAMARVDWVRSANTDYNPDMDGFVLILLSAALANNAVLTHLLGVDPAIRSDARMRDAGVLALATGYVLLLVAIAAWLIERFMLIPLAIDWLRPLAWLLLIAAIAPWPRFVLRKRNGDTHALRASSPMLLIGNGLLLGVIALGGNAQSAFGAMLARTLGAAIGFGIVLVLFTAMRDRLDGADVPAPFRGAPITLISAALLALGFLGFAGIGHP